MMFMTRDVLLGHIKKRLRKVNDKIIIKIDANFTNICLVFIDFKKPTTNPNPNIAGIVPNPNIAIVIAPYKGEAVAAALIAKK